MSPRYFIVAIELGSTKIKGIAGQKKNDGSINVLAVVEEDSTQCMRNGVVLNTDKTVQCITGIVQQLRSKLHANIKHVFVGVGGRSIHSVLNVIVREIDDVKPVTQELVCEMMDQNRAMKYPEKEILDVRPLEYRADNLNQIDPVGVLCKRLEGNFLNILQGKNHYQNLNSCFRKAEVKIAENYLAPCALADAVLTPVEKRSGCLLVDLGADTTTVMIYYKNVIRHIAVIPLGGSNITKDIMNCFQVEEEDAEKLKLQYASAYTDYDNIDQSLKYDIDYERKVESSRFIEVVEARVQEIVANVWNQIPDDYSDKLLGGLILTGGGSNLKNIDVAFSKQTGMEKIRLAKFVTYTVNSTDPKITAHDGTMNTLIGLLAKGDQNCWMAAEDVTKPVDMFSGDEGKGDQTASQPTADEPRDPKTLGEGIIPTPEEMEAIRIAREKKEAEENGKNSVNGGTAGNEDEAENGHEAKGKGFGSKLASWFMSFTEED